MMKTLLAISISGILMSAAISADAHATSQADQLLAERYAPKVNLHPDERFFPDSVNNYIDAADPGRTHKNGGSNINLVPASTLGGDYSYPNPQFLYGNPGGVEAGNVPVYSYIKNVGQGIVDIVYAMYYPYNLGKTTCEALEFDAYVHAELDSSVTGSFGDSINQTLDTSLLCTTNGQNIDILNVGIGKVSFKAGVPDSKLNMTFGNHTTDAEYYVVRLVNNQPTKVMIGAHGVYKSYDWNQVNKEGGTHGVIYSGNGGHGHHLTPGKHRVLVKESDFGDKDSFGVDWRIFSLSAGYDVSGHLKTYSIDHTANGGKEWRTWQNVNVFRWTKEDNHDGYQNLPGYEWVKDYNGVHWGSEAKGHFAEIELGITWEVDVSERFCVPFTSICQTIGIDEGDTYDTSVTFDERELSATNGSVKIGRADNMFNEAASKWGLSQNTIASSRIPSANLGQWFDTDGRWGNWGGEQRCPIGSYVDGMHLKSEGNQGGNGDDTALNGVKLFCSSPYERWFTNITSAEGNWGSYITGTHCDSYVTGFDMLIEGDQGNGDDTAANSVRLYCQNGQVIAPATRTHWGNWTSRHNCPAGQVVVGLRTRVESSQGGNGDDTALNGMRLICEEVQTNLARAGVASLSSTYPGHDATFAINGNVSGHASQGDVAASATPSAGETWQVDLGSVRYISSSEWWNRGDGWQDRMDNYTIEVSLDGTTWIKVSHQTSQMGRPTIIPINADARYVRIKQNKDAYLNFAEAKIFGK